MKTVTCLRQHPRRIATITSPPPPPPPLLLAAAHCRPQKMIKWKLKLFFHDNSNFFPSLAMCVCVLYVCVNRRGICILPFVVSMFVVVYNVVIVDV